MPRDFKRADRVADAVQRSLAQLIPSEIQDPRLGMVNINAVEVTKDLAHAKVYVTFVGQDDPQACRASVEILNSAAPYLRTLLGRQLSTRITPRPHFVYDESAVRGQAIRQLIDRAIAQDSAHRDEHED